MGLLKEIAFAFNGIKLRKETGRVVNDETRNFIETFEKVVDKHGSKVATIFEGNQQTYQQLEERANRYASWVEAQGIGTGKIIALLMENRDEYLPAWLGILKSGNTASLINYNLVGAPLKHSLDVCNAKHVILGAEVAENYMDVKDQLEHQPDCWVQGGAIQGTNNLDEALATQSTTRPNKKLEHGSDALYIYTSGTTGNPKAARISHRRLIMMSWIFAAIMKAKPKDNNYLALPLYHSAGGV